ncbi:hypothetical protein MKZ38_000469 [Zalerion maritima]|uniref:Uncharacterized protein n=1 Tax=Zalerion maritima TaxID=339359 RepID=A0AAD5RG62_9PEZI|nr:hypothetical protein MKZ38_000469 [Zalerion maritima]
MSRITAPTSKLVRAMSTTSQVVRRSKMVASAAAAAPRLAQSQERSTTEHTRPFHPTPAASARMDTSSIDFCKMPDVASFEAVNTDPFARIRVPLAPDAFSVHHEPEATVEPLAKPEISVMAADPATVMPAALGQELEGFEYGGVTLGFAHEKATEPLEEPAGGMIKDIWGGLVDDLNVTGNRKILGP